MKPILIPFFILILTAPLLQAQNHTTGAREQVEAFRVAYYTRELNLSSEEAQRFWPVYNEFSDALEENKVAERQTQMALRQAYVGGSDQEVEKLLSKLMELKREEVDLTIRYHESFKAVLPIRKVAMLYKAETDFKRKLLEHLQERRQERLNGRP